MKKRVIVIGGINMDIVAFTKDHPKEGETVLGDSLKYFPGGKGANQAIASSKLGSETLLIGKVGDDSFGSTLISFLKSQKVKLKVSKTNKASTGVGIITVASSSKDNTIVSVSGANLELIKRDIANVSLHQGDILVGQCETSLSVVEELFRRGRNMKTVNVFNVAPAQKISNKLMSLVDVLIVNTTELEIISKSNINTSDISSIKTAINKITNKKLSVIVTLGKNGVIAFIHNKFFIVKGRKVKVVDPTGAGDCFVGAFASQLSKGVNLVNAIKFSNTAASLSVTKMGASAMPTLKEVNKFN